MARAGVAFPAAIATGVPVGLVMGVSPVAAALLDPFVQFLRPLPKLALIPLMIVWFGIGEFSKFFLIYIATLLSVMVSAAGAVASVGRDRRRAAAVLGGNRYQMFRHVLRPSILPELFTGIRLALGIGWTTLIAAEMVAASSGLGWMVVNRPQRPEGAAAGARRHDVRRADRRDIPAEAADRWRKLIGTDTPTACSFMAPA